MKINRLHREARGGFMEASALEVVRGRIKGARVPDLWTTQLELR